MDHPTVCQIKLNWGDLVKTKQGYYLTEAEIAKGQLGVYAIQKPSENPDAKFSVYRLTVSGEKTVGSYTTFDEAKIAAVKDLCDLLESDFS